MRRIKRRRGGDHRGSRLAAGNRQRPGRQHSRAVPLLRHSRHSADVAAHAARGSTRTLRGFETFVTQTGPMSRHVEDLWLACKC